jgi:hypothetical protein
MPVYIHFRIFTVPVREFVIDYDSKDRNTLIVESLTLSGRRRYSLPPQKHA